MSASLRYDATIFLLFLELTATTIQNSKYNEEDVDFVLPKSQMILEPSMWYRALQTSSMTLDNVWVTTIAGRI